MRHSQWSEILSEGEKRERFFKTHTREPFPAGFELSYAFLPVRPTRHVPAYLFRRFVSFYDASEYVFHRGGSAIPTSTFNTQFAAARKAAGVSTGKLFHDLRRTAAWNMVRGGVPQSIAMRVTGHRSRSMFDRYDIASLDDKLDALHRAREYASTRRAVGENVSAFPSPPAVNPPGTPEGIGPVLRGKMVAVQV